MIDQKPNCDELVDDRQLWSMLRDESESSESIPLLDHLEQCSACRERLDALAADETDLKMTVDVLSNRSAFDSHLRHRTAFAEDGWTESMAVGILSPPSHPEMLGRIGRYDIERLIGSGGMGIVFKAHDSELNRPAAIKLLAPYLAGSGAARNRFAREARAAAAVVDEHVVAIHNVESGGQHPFLVMKYIAGGSLQQRLNENGPLGVHEVLRIGMQTARGLAAAHAQGLIHRDVKPSNILLDEGVERALLTDFGLARASDDANLTRSGFHPGTPHFMSPEQVRGDEIDSRSDLFGLGCVMYAMCTGHPPFRSETSYAVMRRITDDTPRSIREINPDVPLWLEQIVMKLLEKQRDMRFCSAEEVADLLEGCLAHVQQPASVALPEIVQNLQGGDRLNGPGKSFNAFWGFVRSSRFAFMALPLLFAGVLFILELNKGTLRIETNGTRDVPIRILRGDDVVERLTVESRGTAVRLAAGNYVVEVDDDEDPNHFVIDGDRVTLSRGGDWVVRVTYASGEDTANPGRTDDASANDLADLRFPGLPTNTEIHAVGCYNVRNGETVRVRVEDTGKPIVVVLTAYFGITWDLSIAADADVRGVIVGGYFGQHVAGKLPRDVPQRVLTYFPVPKTLTQAEKTRRFERCFYAYSAFDAQFGKMLDRLKGLCGKDLTSFQCQYFGDSFTINGRRGREVCAVAKRWRHLKSAGESAEDEGIRQETHRVQRQLDSIYADGLAAADVSQVTDLLDGLQSRTGLSAAAAASPEHRRAASNFATNVAARKLRERHAVEPDRVHGFAANQLGEPGWNWFLYDPSTAAWDAPPVHGCWELSIVEEDGVELDPDSLEQWKKIQPDWSRITIRSHSALTTESRGALYDLIIYDVGDGFSRHTGFQISGDGLATPIRGSLMRGRFISDHLAVTINSGVLSDARSTEESRIRQLKLTYHRVEDSDSTTNESSHPKKLPLDLPNDSPFDSPFATPEALIDHFAACQLKDDVAGCVECYSDRFVNSFAASQLLTAQMMVQFSGHSPGAELDEKSLQMQKQVKALINRSLMSDVPAIASAGLLAATEAYRDGFDGEPSPEQMTLIASSPSLLKDPRQFIVELDKLLPGEEPVEGPAKKSTGYVIRRVGERTLAVEADESMGLELREFDGRWLIDGLAELPPTAPSAANAEGAVNRMQDWLQGAWRVIGYRDADTNETLTPHENMVLTIDDLTAEWTTEPEPPTKFAYRLLAEDRIELVAVDKSHPAHDGAWQCRISKLGQDLFVLNCQSPNANHSSDLILRRIDDDQEHSTFTSRVITIDENETYGWAISSLRDERIRLIQSEGFLSSVSWPDDIAFLNREEGSLSQLLQSELKLWPIEDDSIELGMHGPVQSLRDRDRLVEIIANAYAARMKHSRTPAARKVIKRLRHSHATACCQRDLQERKYAELLKSNSAEADELQVSQACLAEVNDELTQLSEKLLQYGVPVIGGSLELSLQRASRWFERPDEPMWPKADPLLQLVAGVKWRQLSRTVRGQVMDDRSDVYMVITPRGCRQIHVADETSDSGSEIISEHFVRFHWLPTTAEVDLSTRDDWSNLTRGIARLDGDRLLLCFAEEGKRRPTAFSTKGDAEGAGVLLYEYRREPDLAVGRSTSNE